MTTPLQKTLPYDPVAQRALPGIQPLPPEEWLIIDEAYAGQMALRDALLADHRDKVLALDDSAHEAALEMLDMVLQRAYPGAGDSVTRPDRVTVPINRDDPLATIGRLIQEDVNILQKQGDEHVLTGGVMCFPASWTLSEKFMRPMVRIHKPVTDYDKNIAKRVQRLFDGIRPGKPLWRFNVLGYHDPALHQPRTEDAPRYKKSPKPAGYLRSERQVMMRLPRTGAVAFIIHTYVIARKDAPPGVLDT